MSKKEKRVCPTHNYVENFLILASTSTRCIWSSAYTSLVFLFGRTTSSATELNIFAKTSGIRKYKSKIKKKKKKHDKIVMLAKSKLIRIEFFVCKALLVDSNISHGHDKFVLINNVLKEHGDIKEEIKNLKI